MPKTRSKIKRCPECKKQVPYSVKTCPVCGYDFTQTKNTASSPVEVLEKYSKKEKRKRVKEEVYELGGTAMVTALLFYLYGFISVFYATLAFNTHLWWWVIWLYAMGVLGFGEGSLIFMQRKEALLTGYIYLLIGMFTFLPALILLGSILFVLLFVIQYSKREIIVTDKEKK